MANPIKNLANIISSNINDLRSITYLSTSDNKKQQLKLRDDIYKAIDDLNNKSFENTGMNSMSSIYSRLLKSINNDKTLPNDITNLFNNDTLMSSLAASYMDNKPIYDYDREIDQVCSYMPKLQEALDTKKDHVLSPDHFSKDFLKIKKDSDLTIEDLNTDEKIFNRDIKLLKKKYNLESFIEESYMKVSKYGEDFIYCVPYSTAIHKLLQDKEKYQNTMNTGILGTLSTQINENGDIKVNLQGENIKGNVVNESYDIKYNGSIDKDSFFKDHSPKLVVEIQKGNYIESLIQDSNFVSLKESTFNEMSLVREAANELQDTVKDASNGKIGDTYIGSKSAGKLRPFDRILDDKILVDNTAKDGLINTEKQINNKLELKGCILKSIDRHRIVPIYIDDINMGYYYFEFQENSDYIDNARTNNIFGANTKNIQNSDKDIRMQDMLLKSIAATLSSKLDAMFINNNQDISKEIYSILKYNDLYNLEKTETKMKVSYIPPEDIRHCYFRKDPVTHRGISDLWKSLIPAKLWVCLNLTYIIGNMTRGQDKRVYYVKQTVDTNIAQTLLTTMDQIKRSNFNVRQIENINNILNIIGRFNDYVIPRSQGGESPVEFEVMPGQDIQPPTEIMDRLEESAINATDVPLDVINARMSMDFATHYTMSNTRFLRRVIKRQAICEEERMYSGLITRIYNLEYGKSNVLELVLPVPLFLDVSNTSQILQNVADLCNNITEAYLVDEEDENVKNIFTKRVKMDYLSTYINIEKLSEYLEDARIEAKRKEILSGNSEE